ncbi:MAG: T6SS effector amidase Tae4 family protein [Flectobacillus sp.]|uniref:T6SS effector amidase Tae4 family protein n=1 Tax=Flectobacillus sp. TaxID=50419 RepID=UPI003B9BC422
MAKFKNRRGIICFEVTGWNDATGHFTLWDGNNILYGQHDYFNLPSEGKGAKVTKAYLWEC